MPPSQLLTYDPNSHEKFEANLQRLPVLWKQAVNEKREHGRILPETKTAYLGAIENMRRARKQQYKTTADVARRIFNILSAREYLSAVKSEERPDPETFGSLKELREFFTREMERIKASRRARRPMTAFSLPVAPRDELGLPFGDGDNPQVITQGVYIPDIDGGFAMLVTVDRSHKGRLAVCVSGKSSPQRFRTHMPQIATLLKKRMFAGDDAQDMTFYVHHPVGIGPNAAEQFWIYDMRADSLNRFHYMGRNMVPLLPHGIAHPRFADGLEANETGAVTLDTLTEYAPGVEMMVRKQERVTARLGRVAAWRASKMRM